MSLEAVITPRSDGPATPHTTHTRSTAQQGTEATPEPAAPQHIQALRLANRVRLARAALKRAVESGDRSVAEVIVTCPWEAETMSIADLLLSQRRWGRTRCRKFLNAVPMHENKPLGSLTVRQRLALAGRLDTKGTDSADTDSFEPVGVLVYASV
jgi:hypothetical protein